MWTIYLLVSSLFASSAFPLIFTIENKVSRLKTLVTNHFRSCLEIDRLTLITSGVTMRGRHVGFHTQNPRNPARQRPDTTRIRVKGVPLSADDGQIRRTLGCP
jgi:hypothetical protein